MSNESHVQSTTARLGRWLPRDGAQTERWIRKLRQSVVSRPRDLVPPVLELRRLVHADPVLRNHVDLMFAEAYWSRKKTPLEWEPEVKDFEEFLTLLNAIMTTAPEAYQTEQNHEQGPAGLIGFPINALLDWPMATLFGYDVFSNLLVNQQLKKILDYWSDFLVSEASRYVLIADDPETDAIAWLGPQGQKEMVGVACAAVGEGHTFQGSFAEIFNCTPGDKHYGFKSWDDFFTRTFAVGARPVSSPKDDNVVVNACESAPFALHENAALSASFWLKGQPYSLQNMLNWDEWAPAFAGGTVYQAFLSALSYHRWHSPVNGTIKKAYVVNGTYYLENLHQGFLNPHDPDPSAPNNSQAFLTAVATRALIFIEADNAAIGLMCVVLVGMAEVSSCEITVKAGDHVKKGEELGMFHFGGSTHCLVFRPGVHLQFDLYQQKPGPDAERNIRINTAIARVVR